MSAVLAHWGQVTHICVSKLTIIGSDYGFSPGRHQAITWTNAGLLLIKPLGTNFSEMLFGIQTFSFKKMHFKMSSAKWRPFCFGLNVLSWHRLRFYVTAYGALIGCGIWRPLYPGPWFNIKMSSYQYRKSQCGDKTVVRSSYLHNGIFYSGKMSSLYWISPLVYGQVPVQLMGWSGPHINYCRGPKPNRQYVYILVTVMCDAGF